MRQKENVYFAIKNLQEAASEGIFPPIKKKWKKEQPSIPKSFHIKVSNGEMFLRLLVHETMTFADIDDFLRAIWLECCGHLSNFQVKGRNYDWDDDSDYGEKMSSMISSVFKKGMKIQYDYDFGSTTRLDIKVVNRYSINVSEGIMLLSRNEPLPILCHICKKKPAELICSICIYEGTYMFCETCAKKHKKTCSDFADYAELAVVNSPRMGVCAYEGGGIDIERDGVWRK